MKKETIVEMFDRNYQHLKRCTKQIDYNNGGDLLHDMFFVLLNRCERSSQEFSSDDAFRAYFYVCAKHRYYSERERMQKSTEFQDWLVSMNADFGDFGESDILNIINKMPDGRRKTVLIMLTEGYGVEDVRIRYRLTPVNARTVVFDARKWLYERITGQSYSKKQRTAGHAKSVGVKEVDERYVVDLDYDMTLVDKVRCIINKHGSMSCGECWEYIKNSEQGTAFRSFHNAYWNLKYKGEI